MRIALSGTALLAICIVCAAWSSDAHQWQDTRLLLTLAGLAMVIDRVVVRIGPMSFSGSTPILVLAMVLLGPGPAVLIACIAAALGPDYRGRRHWQFADAGIYAAFTLVGSMVFIWADHDLSLTRGEAAFPVAVLLTAVSVDIVNFVLVTGFKRAFQGVAIRQSVRETLLPLLPWTLVSAGLTAGTAHAYVTLGFGAVPVLGGLLGSYGLLLLVISRAEERGRQVQLLSADRDRLRLEASQAGERERRRIGAALHDDAMQTLLAARQDVTAALEGDPRALDTAHTSLTDGVAKLRAVLGALHPPRLPERDLETSLRVLLQQTEQHGLTWRLSLDPEAAGADDALVYLTSRELVSNVVRHAHASVLELSLWRSDEGLVLDVGDDGGGIDPDARERAVRAGHIGLSIVEDRVAGRGGDLAVSGGPGGTRVRARLPAGDRLLDTFV
jgi:signal transduction histidine kinase